MHIFLYRAVLCAIDEKNDRSYPVATTNDFAHVRRLSHALSNTNTVCIVRKQLRVLCRYRRSIKMKIYGVHSDAGVYNVYKIYEGNS